MIFKKTTLLVTLAIALLSACVGRSESSNNNNENNNNNQNSNNNNAPIGWVLVGEADISGADAASPILKFYDNVPYVAFLDNPSGTVSVVRYTAATDTWDEVGVTGFSAGSSSLSFEIDSTSGDLYLAYSDGEASGKLTVKKYDGASWSDVGSAGFSTGVAEYVSLTLLDGTTPYVAYYDVTLDAVKIQKYSSGWTVLADGSVATAKYVYITSDDTDVYLAYIVDSTDQVSLAKYNVADSWDAIASPTTNRLKDISLFINGSHLFFAGIDLDNSDEVILERYDTGTLAWDHLATSEYVSDGAATTPSIYITNNGVSNEIAYIAYSDNTVSDKASTKICMDNSPHAAVACTDLGGLGFSDTAIEGISLSYDDGHPYVAYVDTITNRIEVRKY